MVARIWEGPFVNEVVNALSEAGYYVKADFETVVVKINEDDKMKEAVFTAILKSSWEDVWVCRIAPGLIEGV